MGGFFLPLINGSIASSAYDLRFSAVEFGSWESTA